MINKPRVIANDVNKVLFILENIINNNEDNNPIIDYPVLIGSRAAKWHISSFREPNDWDLVTTLSQSISFISIFLILNYLVIRIYFNSN